MKKTNSKYFFSYNGLRKLTEQEAATEHSKN
jgi:hypothetical protein